MVHVAQRCYLRWTLEPGYYQCVHNYVHYHRQGLLTSGDISAFRLTTLYSPGLLLTAVPDAPLVAALLHVFAEFML